MFPIAPEAIDTDVPNRDETVDLASGLEYNRRNPVGLKELSFSVFLPRFGGDLPQALIDTPGQDIYNELLRLKNEGTVFSFAVLKPSAISFGPHAAFIQYATVWDLRLHEDAAELGVNLKVDITIKEFRFETNERVNLNDPEEEKKTEEPAQRPVEVATGNQSYVVKKGDSLESIARQFFGDTSNGASLIYQTNKTAIDDRAAKDNMPKGYLAVGQVLTIPPYARPAAPTQRTAAAVSSPKKSAPSNTAFNYYPAAPRPSTLQPTDLRNNTANFVKNAGTLGPHQQVTYVQPKQVMYTPPQPRFKR